MDHEAERLSQRGTFLTVAMTVMGGSVFLFFLFLVCGGLAVYVMAVVAGMASLGLVHYLLWGHALSADIAGKHNVKSDPDQVDAEAREPEGAKDWSPEERSWYHRF
jgi:hypothetical protein